MRAKEYLQNIRGLDLEIHIMGEEGNKTAELIDQLSKQNRGGKETAAAILNLMGLAVQINECISRLDALSGEIRAKIDALKEPQHRHVLILRYFLCKDWWEIAAETNYSERSVYRLHAAALVELEKIL